jgi:hypothetical protein
MSTVNTLIAREFEKQISLQIEELRTQLENPSVATDYPAYCGLCGRIAGLRASLEIISEAESTINKRT